MDGELKQKILAYADKAYAAAYHNSLQEAHEETEEYKRRAAARGTILSGATVQEIAKIQGQQIVRIVRAKAEGLLDAFELYGADIDDSILQQATELLGDMVSAISNAISILPPSAPTGDMFRRLLYVNTGPILDTLSCEIEKRKLMPKLRPGSSVVQHVHHEYHLHGDNTRVNLQSTDNSVNVVNITNTELFVRLRQVLTENTTGATHALILEKLDALEQAQNSPTFAQRYKEFRAAAADYLTLLSPFIPAFMDMLHRAVVG